MKNAVAIITARGGSKRIPGKNIKDFSGKPIIQYSIDAALGSGIFEEVMVSTDDPAIADIAIKLGAKVPFLRSAENSNDYATTAQVILEVLEEYRKTGREFTYGCCIYPTAPFVTASKLKEAHRVLEEKQAEGVIPVTKFSFPIQRSFKMDNGKLSYNWPEHALTRSQDLPPAFHDAGQFYFLKIDEFLKSRRLVSSNTYALEMPESEVQDIDNEEDWRIAEIKYSFFIKK